MSNLLKYKWFKSIPFVAWAAFFPDYAGANGVSEAITSWTCEGVRKIGPPLTVTALLRATVSLNLNGRKISYKKAERSTTFPHTLENPGPIQRAVATWPLRYRPFAPTLFPDQTYSYGIIIEAECAYPYACNSTAYDAFRFYTNVAPSRWTVGTTFSLEVCQGDDSGESCDSRYKCHLSRL